MAKTLTFGQALEQYHGNVIVTAFEKPNGQIHYMYNDEFVNFKAKADKHGKVRELAQASGTPCSNGNTKISFLGWFTVDEKGTLWLNSVKPVPTKEEAPVEVEMQVEATAPKRTYAPKSNGYVKKAASAPAKGNQRNVTAQAKAKATYKNFGAAKTAYQNQRMANA